jgi:hypothetical protein
MARFHHVLIESNNGVKTITMNKRLIGPQFRHNLRCGGARFVCLVGREADGADAGVAAAAVALADRGQVHHLGGVGLGPRIGANRDLGAEAGLRQADGIGRVGVEVVGDELVESLERMVGDVEEDGAVALFGAAANQLQCFLVALEQRRQQIAPRTAGAALRPAASR